MNKKIKISQGIQYVAVAVCLVNQTHRHSYILNSLTDLNFFVHVSYFPLVITLLVHLLVDKELLYFSQR